MMRAVDTAREGERYASYAQVTSCAMYLTLLVCGTLPWVVLWSTALALQETFIPTQHQRRQSEFYPETLLPVVTALTVALEIGFWLFFQWIR